MINEANVSIFAGSSGYPFAEKICSYMGMKLGNSQVVRFSEGNTFVRVNESVRDRHVYLVQPIAMQPNDEFVEILFWLDAFKRSSAMTVTLIMPYFGYAKGDKKDEPRTSIRARVCAESIELAGADRIMIMDLHSGQVQGFFKRPMDHLYAMPLLVEYAKRLNIDDAVVVAPDAGSAKQTRRFGAALKMPVAISDKQRTDHSESAEVLEVIGEVKGKNAIITDDFTISGGTLVNLAYELKKRDVKRIIALLSHNMLSDKGVKMINDSPIEMVVSTDSVSNPHIVGHPKFKTLSVAPIFAETVSRFHNHQSIHELSSSLSEELCKACLANLDAEMR